MCAIDWGFIAAWVVALATVGLLLAAIYGFGIWRSQYEKTRDHDLARRILSAISDSHVVFDELRTPHAPSPTVAFIFGDVARPLIKIS